MDVGDGAGLGRGGEGVEGREGGGFLGVGFWGWVFRGGRVGEGGSEIGGRRFREGGCGCVDVRLLERT